MKQICYNENDIAQIMEMLNAITVQGINNAQIVSGIVQILATKQVNSESEGDN